MADDLDVDDWQHLRDADTDEVPVLDDDLLAVLEAEMAAEAAESSETDDDEVDEEDVAVEDDDVVDTGPRAKVIELAPDGGSEFLDSDDDEPRADGEDPDADPEDPEAVVVDTRMRDRRIAVRREEGRRRLRRLAWGLGGLVLLVDGAALVQTPMVDVEHIQVTGAAHTGAPTVEWASGIDPGDATLTIDERAAEHRIEKLAWVATADVQKEWPSTVRVTVTERVPAAVIESAPGKPRALVDESGRILQIGGVMPPGLVTVTGVPSVMREGDRVPAEVRDALRIAVVAPVQVPGAITAVSVKLQAALTRGGVVRFGSVDELDEKLVAVATVLARVDMRCLRILDVKVPGSPTVSRQPC